MKLATSYAFSKSNQVGQSSGKIQTPLTQGQTIKGDPVIALCQPDSFIPRADGAALVARDKEGHWQPIASFKDLEAKLASTKASKLGDTLGIWSDSRHLLVKPKDGIAQDREVQPLQAHWDAHAQSDSIRYEDLGVRNGDPQRTPQAMAVGWSFTDSSVHPDKITVSSASFPGKQVAVLEEPLFVDQHEILRVTDFRDGEYFTPTAVESTIHSTKAPSKTTDHANYDLAPLIYDDTAVEYVLPS